MAFWKSAHAHPIRSHEFKVNWDGALSHTVKSCTKPSIEVNGNEYQVGNQFFKHPGVAKWNDITLTFVDDKTTTRLIFQQLINQGLLIPLGQKRYGGMDLGGDAPNGGGFGTKAEEEMRAQRKEYNKKAEGANVKAEILGNSVRFKMAPEWPPDPEFGQWSDDSMKKGKIGDIIIEQHSNITKREVVEDKPGTLFRPPQKGGSKQVSFKKGGGPYIQETWKLKNAWIKSINFGSLDYSSDELITIEVTISYDWCEVEFPMVPRNYS